MDHTHPTTPTTAYGTATLLWGFPCSLVEVSHHCSKGVLVLLWQQTYQLVQLSVQCIVILVRTCSTVVTTWRRDEAFGTTSSSHMTLPAPPLCHVTLFVVM